MSRSVCGSLCWIFVSVVFVAGFVNQAAASAQAPAAPTMPTGWKVTSDQSFAQAAIKPISDRLGGTVTALRNTVYDVNGKPVKLNTIVTASEVDADKIMASLQAMKPAEFMLRQGLIIYEFVGTNDVIPDIRTGRAHLQTNRGF